MEKETGQNLVVKKVPQSRAAIMAGIFALSAASTAAHAYTEVQNFTGVDSGGIITFQDIAPNTLQITFDNTSLYSGIITGLVFNISDNINNASITSFLDGNGNDIMSSWGIDFNVNNNITPGNTVFEVAFTTYLGINGGIYNDGTATNMVNAFPDIATLILSISDPDPWNFLDVAGDSILRTQRTGVDGEGSDKIVTSSSSSSSSTSGGSTSSTSSTSGGSSTSTSGGVVSEPGVLGLLGIGLLGQILLLRRRRLGA